MHLLKLIFCFLLISTEIFAEQKVVLISGATRGIGLATTKAFKEKGWGIGNIDAMVCLEAPKINPHIPAMKANIAKAAGIDEDDISIKATTNEKLGFIGREEGVVAYAVCLIEKI